MRYITIYLACMHGDVMQIGLTYGRMCMIGVRSVPRTRDQLLSKIVQSISVIRSRYTLRIETIVAARGVDDAIKDLLSVREILEFSLKCS